MMYVNLLSSFSSGGIKLAFTGQYLNVSQQPILQFNDGQTTTVSIIHSSSYYTSELDLSCSGNVSAKQLIRHYSGVYSSSSVCTEQLHCCNGCSHGPNTSNSDLHLATNREKSRRVDLGVNVQLLISM